MGGRRVRWGGPLAVTAAVVALLAVAVTALWPGPVTPRRQRGGSPPPSQPCHDGNPLVPLVEPAGGASEGGTAQLGSTWQAWATAHPGGRQHLCRNGEFAADFAGVFWFPPRIRTPIGRFKYLVTARPDDRVLRVVVGFRNTAAVLGVLERGGPTETVEPADLTSYREARREVMALLPPDARLGRERVLPAEGDAGCLLRLARSRTLTGRLGDGLQVVVVFDGSEESAFDPTRVPSATIAAVPVGRALDGCFLAVAP